MSSTPIAPTRTPAPAGVLRVVAATVEVVAGLVAVASLGLAVGHARTGGALADRALVVGLWAVLGAGFVMVWWLARRRGSWLLALIIGSGVLAAGFVGWTALRLADLLVYSSAGLWEPFWSLLLAGLGWLLVTVAGLVERRCPARHPLPWPRRLAAVAAPLAAFVVLGLLIAWAFPAVLVRANARTEPASAAGPAYASRLDGSRRWTTNLADGGHGVPVATAAGVAVPVGSMWGGSAGVDMIDAATGKQRWRFRLRGTVEAPGLALTDDGHALVLRSPDADRPIFTLDATTGRVLAVWPGDVVGDDPPVGFARVADGTNTVTGYDSRGHRRWAYRPARCADPRSVHATPRVALVVGRVCGGNDTELIGLDAATGRRLWGQPFPDGEGPTQLLVRPGYEIERVDRQVQRRNLDDGTVTWGLSLPESCIEPVLAADDESLVLACGSTVTAYSAADGRPRWSQRLDAGDEVPAVAAAGSSALAVTPGKRGCEVRRLDADGVRLLFSVLSDDPAHPRCADATALRVGDTEVLSLPVKTGGEGWLQQLIGLG